MIGQVKRLGMCRGIGGQRGDQQAQQEPRAARHTLCVVLGDLFPVIGKPDQPKAQCYQQHDPDIDIVQPRPQQSREGQRAKDQHAPHRRRACLDEMGLRPVDTDRLALFLTRAQEVDHRLPENEPEQQRREKRGASAERDIAEQVKNSAAVRKLA